MHSLLHDIPRFFILFLEELFLIFKQMLSIRAFGRREMGTLANNKDWDKRLQNVAFYQDLHCFLKIKTISMD